jgi:hypothetical protein
MFGAIAGDLARFAGFRAAGVFVVMGSSLGWWDGRSIHFATVSCNAPILTAYCARLRQFRRTHSEEPNVRHSETFAAISAALAAANAEFPPIEKNKNVEVKMRNGGTYWFSYATLDAILHAVRLPLAKNGLALMQAEVQHEVNVYDDGGRIVAVDRELMMETRLLHSSGEWFANTTPILIAEGDNAAQAHGSGASYARRYGVSALLCLASDEDDDGNEADGNSVKPARAPGGRRDGAVISDAQLRLLRVKLDQAGGNEAAAAKHFGVESLGLLPRGRMDEAMKAIAEKHPALLEAGGAPSHAAMQQDGEAMAANGQYNALLAKHMESFLFIRYHLGVVRDEAVQKFYDETELTERDPMQAAQEWNQFTDDEKRILWRAPSNGGWLTTKERTDLRAAGVAYSAHLASQKKD